jgi:hypothetical protein
MSGLNLLVFRGDQRRVSGQELKAALTAQLEQLRGHCSHDGLLVALLRAGELECGVADGGEESACRFELVTDRIAEALVAAASIDTFQEPDIGKNDFQQLHINQQLHIKKLRKAAQALPVLEQLSISTPEGFAYYALHPLAYADILREIPACENLLVVGIRSIGTTLSAVAAAAARARGIHAERITVRPQGHPYDRSAEFTIEQMAAIRKAVSCGASFAVVDEGPGLSGSSFLAVAGALERAGAPAEKIVLLSSHAPNVDALCATDAARRWRRFRCLPVMAETRRPVQANDFIGGGQWRSRFLSNKSEWPASWTSLERLKYLSLDKNHERRMFKFDGFGHYGDVVVEREEKVAAAGFGLMPRAESDGFVSYPQIDGRPLSASDLSAAMMVRLAEYCAFRLRAFAIELSDLKALQQMAAHNLHELGLDLTVDLRLAHPVIADGHMQPHEWLQSHDGDLLKTDSGSHGDDHFFPGPTDIAWDLAGAIVEWHMNEEQAKEFLTYYRRASGDDALARIDGYVKAYTVFRTGYCLMAADAMRESDEQPRLQRAADVYRTRLMRSRAHVAMPPSSLSSVTF